MGYFSGRENATLTWCPCTCWQNYWHSVVNLWYRNVQKSYLQLILRGWWMVGCGWERSYACTHGTTFLVSTKRTKAPNLMELNCWFFINMYGTENENFCVIFFGTFNERKWVGGVDGRRNEKNCCWLDKLLCTQRMRLNYGDKYFMRQNSTTSSHGGKSYEATRIH